jgi:hypothetical protein
MIKRRNVFRPKVPRILPQPVRAHCFQNIGACGLCCCCGGCCGWCCCGGCCCCNCCAGGCCSGCCASTCQTCNCCYCPHCSGQCCIVSGAPACCPVPGAGQVTTSPCPVGDCGICPSCPDCGVCPSCPYCTFCVDDGSCCNGPYCGADSTKGAGSASGKDQGMGGGGGGKGSGGGTQSKGAKSPTRAGVTTTRPIVIQSKPCLNPGILSTLVSDLGKALRTGALSGQSTQSAAAVKSKGSVVSGLGAIEQSLLGTPSNTSLLLVVGMGAILLAFMLSGRGK